MIPCFLVHLISSTSYLPCQVKGTISSFCSLVVLCWQVISLTDVTSNLRENIKRGVYVDGLIEEVVTSAAEAYQVSQ